MDVFPLHHPVTLVLSRPYDLVVPVESLGEGAGWWGLLCAQYGVDLQGVEGWGLILRAWDGPLRTARLYPPTAL